VSAPACRAAAAASLLLLAACATPSPKDQPPDAGRPASAESDAAAKASFDWHPLLIAPFGTRLKDSPIRLHEVLLFREQSLRIAEIESKDCYAVDGTPPTFAGHVPDEYLMCFEHDRLDRIGVSVRIAADSAARDFGRACALWSGSAQPLTEAGDACEGRDHDIAWSARLAALLGEGTAELRMSLTNAATRDAEGEPPDPQAPPSPAP
jgi:hypothetical protein